MPHGIVNQLDERMEAELEHDLGAVGLDGPNGDFQLRSDLFIGLPRG